MINKMKITSITMISIFFFIIACNQLKKSDSNEIDRVSINQQEFKKWQNGQIVKLKGILKPSKLTKYYIEVENNHSVHIISADIDKLILKPGTKVWIKGKIEYIHHKKPNDYHEEMVLKNDSTSTVSANYSMSFPFAACFVRVFEYYILDQTTL